MTYIPDFKVTLLFNDEYISETVLDTDVYNELLIRTSHLKWYWVTFLSKLTKYSSRDLYGSWSIFFIIISLFIRQLCYSYDYVLNKKIMITEYVAGMNIALSGQ